MKVLLRFINWAGWNATTRIMSLASSHGSHLGDGKGGRTFERCNNLWGTLAWTLRKSTPM